MIKHCTFVTCSDISVFGEPRNPITRKINRTGLLTTHAQSYCAERNDYEDNSAVIVNSQYRQNGGIKVVAELRVYGSGSNSARHVSASFHVGQRSKIFTHSAFATR